MSGPEVLGALERVGLSRRTLLQVGIGSAGAFVAGFSLPLRTVAATTGGAASFVPNVYIRIAPSGAITYVIPFVEMGQGTFTTIPMLLAEEMDVQLSTVTIEQAPADEKRYGNPLFGLQITGGSSSTQAAWKAVRVAGATCRAMLVSAAAKSWGVPTSECQTQDGRVTHTSSGRQRTYGSLAQTAAAQSVPADVEPKDPRAYRLVGTSAKRLDIKGKTDGSAVFGIDARPSGVKVAAIANSPVFGGRVRRVDKTAAMRVKGVRQVVVADNIVAVVADHYGAAKKGLTALVIEWDDGPNASFSSQSWDSAVSAALTQRGIVTTEGDFASAKAGAAKVVEAEYGAPAMVHACLEPVNCTLHVRRDSCDVWLGTQSPVKVQQAVELVTGIPAAKVNVHNYLIGGGFGRRLDADYVEQAAKIAKQVPYPVKVIYSREEDIQHGTFRPIFRDQLAASLDASGQVTGFSHRFAGSAVVARFAPIWIKPGAADPDAIDAAAGPYSIPHKHVEFIASEPPPGLITAFWRGVGPLHNGWVIDCFMDEIALANNADPVEFRLRHLNANPRTKAVLEIAARKAQWGSRKLPPRSGMGVAVLNAWDSHIALVVELSVADDGSVQVHRLTSALDCGIVINPSVAHAQMEGGHIFGLTAARYGRVTFDKGRVQQSNFHDYQLLRIDEVPAMDVTVVRSMEKPGGIGEIGTAVVAPAFMNALFAATGKRFRNYPVRVEELKA